MLPEDEGFAIRWYGGKWSRRRALIVFPTALMILALILLLGLGSHHHHHKPVSPTTTVTTPTTLAPVTVPTTVVPTTSPTTVPATTTTVPVPTTGSTVLVPVAPGSPAGCTEGITSGQVWAKYTVRPGDNLYDIAQCFDLNGYEGLYQVNKAILGPDANLIHPGQVITITDGTMTVSPVTQGNG